MCYSRYITTDRSSPSRSGLYAQDLPGVDAGIWTKINKENQTPDELWTMLNDKAWQNMICDVTGKFNDKFYVNSKLLSRETCTFTSSINDSTDPAGVNIKFELPRYARIHIVSAQVHVFGDYAKSVIVTIADKDGNELYKTSSQEVGPGIDTVFIDQEFDETELVITYNTADVDLLSTEVKRYNTGLKRISCNSCVNDCGGYIGEVTLINNGGLNVVYNVLCSVEKFVCQNINFFRQPFFYRIGLEIVTERRLGHRLNKYMTMTEERQDELLSYYDDLYQKKLDESIRSHNILEDPFCFTCKPLVQSVASLP